MRLAFLIDGFNVYHSIKVALKENVVKRAKWLDYNAFCRTLPLNIFYFNPSSQIVDIYYFSALPTHVRDIGVMHRHLTYIEALKSTGVNVVLGNFKKKSMQCPYCKKVYSSHEEKETDINIALYLFRLFLEDKCDIATIISGDTDLVAAVSNAKQIFPDKKVVVGFPFRRKNIHFEKVADFTFDIKPKRYERYQLNNPLILPDGKVLYVCNCIKNQS